MYIFGYRDPRSPDITDPRSKVTIQDRFTTPQMATPALLIPPRAQGWVDGSDMTLAVAAACAQKCEGIKLARNAPVGEAPYTRPLEPLQLKTVAHTNTHTHTHTHTHAHYYTYTDTYTTAGLRSGDLTSRRTLLALPSGVALEDLAYGC